MASLFKTFITCLFVVAMLWVLLTNAQEVHFTLPPFFEQNGLSLALIIFGSVITGFMWGALIVWLNGSEMRQQYRKAKQKLKNMPVDAV